MKTRRIALRDAPECFGFEQGQASRRKHGVLQLINV
jgi:hypothetical protein